MTAERVGPPAPDLTSVDVDGNANIYVPSTQRVLTLNETATAIWRLLTGEHTEAQIVEQLAADYGVDASAIAGDVTTALEQFRSEGLLSPPGDHLASPSGDSP